MSNPPQLPPCFPNPRDSGFPDPCDPRVIQRPSIFGVPLTQGSGRQELQQHHGGWAQVPPTVMPWGTPGEMLPNVVRFTGDHGHPFPFDVPPQSSSPTPPPVFMAQKRKSDPDNILQPLKMFITEEKMAAQLKNMHISNQYVSHQGGSGGMDVEADSNINEGILPTLTLSKEVQNLPALDPLLPESLLADYQKPSRALVLWKPPAGDLGERLKQIIQNKKGDNDTQTDSANNNTATPDLNSMASPGAYSADDDKPDAMDV